MRQKDHPLPLQREHGRFRGDCGVVAVNLAAGCAHSHPVHRAKLCYATAARWLRIGVADTQTGGCRQNGPEDHNQQHQKSTRSAHLYKILQPFIFSIMVSILIGDDCNHMR